MFRKKSTYKKVRYHLTWSPTGDCAEAGDGGALSFLGFWASEDDPSEHWGKEMESIPNSLRKPQETCWGQGEALCQQLSGQCCATILVEEKARLCYPGWSPLATHDCLDLN